MVGEMWQRHLNATSDDTTDITIVFTSEASSIVEEQQAFVAEQRRVSRYPSFRFSFLTNEHDVTPDSGFMKDIGTMLYRDVNIASLRTVSNCMEICLSNSFDI